MTLRLAGKPSVLVTRSERCDIRLRRSEVVALLRAGGVAVPDDASIVLMGGEEDYIRTIEVTEDRPVQLILTRVIYGEPHEVAEKASDPWVSWVAKEETGDGVL